MPKRLWAILTIGLGLTLAVLDGGIANVALPTIARDVHTSPANSIWVVNAYQLAVTVSLLPLSSLGEIYGYKRVYMGGLVLFTLASLASAISTSLPTLIIGRMLQGFGAAGLMSVNSALVRFIYPRRWLGRGVGLNATVGSIASALGPTVASGILSVAPWPWLFAVNVPLGVLGAAIAMRALPETPRSGARFDLVSAGLQAVTFGALLFGVSELGHGDSWARVVLELGAAAVCGFLLVTRQMSRTAPMLPVDLLRIPLFALSVASSISSFIAQAMGQVSMPFLFQHRFGLDQVMTGFLMTPWPLIVAVIAPFTGRLADRYPAGLLGGIGMAVMASGLFAMAMLPAHPGTFDIVWRMCLCGLGFGFFNTPNNRAMITSAPPMRTGGASGMQATARLLGQSTGAAMVALVFTAFPTEGPVAALFIAAGAAAVAACISSSRLAAN
ncbi:MFS transporter [Rhodopila sp.]|uniref:MFS transporter n=1 Tax=Rhodopila sp. TaxID=2480087 RepID=UPI002C65D120|nr:MFS transporter [Rhodopila sp.]HVZ09430.1 MFS transporter [Rhodopila sp.]